MSQCRLDIPIGFNTCDLSTQQTYTVQPDGTLPVSSASTFTVKQNISTASGNVDCGAAPDSCGLAGSVWPGEFGVGSPMAIDYPSNNVINFAAWPVFTLTPATHIGVTTVETGMIGNGWAPDAQVTIEIDATTLSPDATVPTDGAGSFNLARGLLVVSAGDLVTVSDGTSTKSLIVPPLAVTDVDVDTNTVSGTAAAGTVEVTLFGTPSKWVADVTSGEWTAEIWPNDLVITDSGFVSQYDEDGDGTMIWWTAPNPTFNLGLIPDGLANMYGNGWAPATEVTIDVDATKRSPDATATTDGVGAFALPGELTVVAGDFVTVSDGTSTKTLIVPPLAVTGVDVDADTMTGTAADGVASVRIGGSYPWSAETMVDVTAGTWAADFSASSASPYDLVGGTFGFVGQMDEDGDSAQIPFVAQTVPGAPQAVSAKWVTTSSVQVSFEAPVSDGGSAVTGYVVECTSSDGGAPSSTSGASSPLTLTKLTVGATYQCQVRAINALVMVCGASLSPSPRRRCRVRRRLCRRSG